jgi:hypothetical protein
VALFPLGLIAAGLDVSALIAIAMCSAGVLIGFFSFDLHRRASRWLRSLRSEYLHQAMEDHRAREAFRLCSEAADVVHALLPPDSRTTATRALRPWHRGRQVLTSYEQLHRATVVHAIEAGLGANAADAGALLALAEDPRDVADLHALHAGLLRMVLELGQRLRPPVEAVAGGSYGA